MKSRAGLLYSPVMHTLVGLALGLAGMSMMPTEPGTPVFVVTALYAVASPVLIALRRWWLVNAILSTIGMIVLLVMMPVLGAMAAGPGSFGSLMINPLPAMIFPCAMVLSGIVRLLIVRREYIAKKTA